MSEKKDWTIMVYMSGDNNLSVDMAYALESIKNVAKDSNQKVNLLVYYDGYSPAIPTLYCDFTDFGSLKDIESHIYYRSYNVKDKLYSVEQEFDENSASEHSVVNFVDWCINKKERKADNYALIFSGHSFGFQSIGLLKDETSDYTMSMEKVDWFLGRITKTETELEDDAGEKPKEKDKLDKWERDTKVIVGQRLEILGFDSCVMSMLEVGYQFKSYAETMIASEGSIPNAGWAYTEILGKLAESSKDADTKEIAKNFVRKFIDTQDKYTIGGTSVDMAAWDLSELDDIDSPLNNLCQKILDCFKDEKSTIYKQIKRVLLQVHKDCQAYMLEQNIDLGDFCELLQSEVLSLKEELGDNSPDKYLDAIASGCERVLKQLRECVLLAGFSGGKYQYSNGISLFFPWSISAYNISKNDYEKLNFIKTKAGKKWREFLVKYLGDVSYRRSISGKVKENFHTYNFYLFNDTDGSNNVDNVDSKSQNDPQNRSQNDPQNRSQNDPQNRFGGVTGHYFEFFTQFDNTETPWNISGFTEKKPEK